jgi:acyl-coenzyme A synthetase/AMP-(fatty) acid ligase
VLSDRPERRSFAAAIDPLDPEDGEGRLQELRRDALALELFSSGSTGDEKRIPKRLRHLDDEVALLEETWGSLLGRTSVISTASHHHLYGLLLGLLWPLAAGRPFYAQQLLRPSELFERAHSLGECALVSVPAHLRRLAQHRNLGALAGRCRAIFSSGGPLPNATARRLAAGAGAPPIEVLGSTETGGIAWRMQRSGSEEASWQPLRQVDVARDPETGAARVRSPFVSWGPRSGFTTADRIAPPGWILPPVQASTASSRSREAADLSRMESDLEA